MTTPRAPILRPWAGLLLGTAVAVAAVLGATRVAWAGDGAGVTPDVLDSVSVRAGRLGALPRWRAALAAFDVWAERAAACRDADCLSLPEKVFLARAERLRLMPLEQRVAAAAVFVDDMLAEAAPAARGLDLSAPWPTLRGILADGVRGPLARTLAQYFTLRMGGVAADRLRLVVARDTLRGQPDIFVAVDLSARQVGLIGRGLTPLTADEAAFHVPLYSFSESARWVHFSRSSMASATVVPEQSEGMGTETVQ